MNYLLGNCLPLDSTVILTTTSSRPNKLIDAEEVSLYRRLDVAIQHCTIDQAYEEESAWMDIFAPLSLTINYKDAVLTHIAG